MSRSKGWMKERWFDIFMKDLEREELEEIENEKA